MRTIEQIKAAIIKNRNRFCPEGDYDLWDEIVKEQDELRAELLEAITQSIPTDRLEEICNAERQGFLFTLDNNSK